MGLAGSCWLWPWLSWLSLPLKQGVLDRQMPGPLSSSRSHEAGGGSRVSGLWWVQRLSLEKSGLGAGCGGSHL